jgi:hypothetical protein
VLTSTYVVVVAIDHYNLVVLVLCTTYDSFAITTLRYSYPLYISIANLSACSFLI